MPADPTPIFLAAPILVIVLAALIFAGSQSKPKTFPLRGPLPDHQTVTLTNERSGGLFVWVGPEHHSLYIPPDQDHAVAFLYWDVDEDLAEFEAPKRKRLWEVISGESWAGAYMRIHGPERPRWRDTPLGEVLEA